MEPFLGQIQAFGFNFAPRGWAKCEGQILQISQNTALFSLLGTMYGGDGRTTFGLPDLRGRTMVGQSENTEMGNVTSANVDSGSSSDSQIHSLGVSMCIALQGVFPSRS